MWMRSQVLGPQLPALLPVLVRGMRYSEMDVILLRGDRDDDADEAEPDRESDIRPRFHKPRSHTIKHNGESLNSAHSQLTVVSNIFLNNIAITFHPHKKNHQNSTRIK